MYREIFLDWHLPHVSAKKKKKKKKRRRRKKKSSNSTCLTNNGCQTCMDSFNSIDKEASISQRDMKKKMLKGLLKEFKTTIVRTRVTGIAEYAKNTKWKWVGHIA